MKHLLRCWPEVRERIRRAASMILFADFDGTLAPFTLRPEDARLSRETRGLLTRLASRRGILVRVISGRGLADLECRIAAPGVRCMGVHGWDTGGGTLPGEVRLRIDQALLGVLERLNGTRGVRVEDKGAGFALHYRGASQEAGARARTAVEAMRERFNGSLSVLPGDCVWEVLPREIRGKGYAARREWRLRDPASIPIYLGNDDTDESAFQALSEGITARVGAHRSSHARYFLNRPWEVTRFLEALDKETG